MTHVEFEIHFAEQAERFGIAKIIKQVGEEYAFQSFMSALSGIVARNQTSSVNEEELEKLATEEADKYCKEMNCGHVCPNDWEIAHDCIRIGYRKAMEEKS